MQNTKEYCPLFINGYLYEYTKIAFLLVYEHVFYDYPRRFEINNINSFLLALDGYSRLTKSFRDNLLIRKFLLNVLGLNIQEFNLVLCIPVKRNKLGKKISYQRCVEEGQYIANRLGKLF